MPSVKQRKKAERMRQWEIHQPTEEWELAEGIEKVGHHEARKKRLQEAHAVQYLAIDSPEERRRVWTYLATTKPISPFLVYENEFQAQVTGEADRYFNRLLDQLAPDCHLSEMPLIKSTRPNGYAQRELNR